MILDASNEVTLPAGRYAIGPLVGIAVHHTVTTLSPSASEATERGHIRAIDSFHVQQGFGGFGYHMLVCPSGRVYQTGSLHGARAHVASRNHELIGIVLVGDFSTIFPTATQDAGLKEAIRFVWGEHGDLEIRGHREWALPASPTACPGNIVPRNWGAFMREEPPVTPDDEIELALKRAAHRFFQAFYLGQYIFRPTVDPQLIEMVRVNADGSVTPFDPPHIIGT